MIELPFPAKILWPNGRTRSFMAKHRELKKHKDWAWKATLAVLPPCFKHDGSPVQIIATFYPKTRNAIDKDNASASLKAYQDGIALAMGINDSLFAEPRIQFGEPVKGGKVVVVLA